ncbi:MAG: hypothetical protein J6Z01_15125 [Bacteroidales bacterium]|nr:hypothetical protein [Bacteroidales bacterium]
MDVVNIFQNLAFPVAVCCVLFAVLIYFFKKIIEIIREAIKQVTAERQEHLEHLKTVNVELTKVIQENTSAFNRFSSILNKLIKEG